MRKVKWKSGSYAAISRMIALTSVFLAIVVLPAGAQKSKTQPRYDEKGRFWHYKDQGDTTAGESTAAETSASDSSTPTKSESAPATTEGKPPAQPAPEYANRAVDQLVKDARDPLELLPEDVDSSLRQDELRGPGRWFFNTRIGQKLARFESGDIRKRPMMYWRRFADRRVPPLGTFLFFLFFNTTICLAFRKRVVVASQCVRMSFWKSLFVGGLFIILMGTAARLCFDSVLYTPCALFFLGVAEFLSLCGLAVSSRTVGLALVTRLGYMQAGQIDGEVAEGTAGDAAARRKARLMYLVPVMVGTVLFTLIALIPGFGPLPRLGTRFVMWFALLGLGALVRTKLGRKELA